MLPRMYFHARNPSSPEVKNHYKRFRAHVQKVIRDAYWKHVSSIFTFDDDNTDPNSPRKNGKVKKFLSFVKSLKKEAFGNTSLRKNGILKTESSDKANICNKQFQSAFTQETDAELHVPSKGDSPFPSMGDITVDPNGVAKLLGKLNIHKASGPNDLNARVLNECSAEISLLLAFIFNESLVQGTLPGDWRQANVSPVYKKGEKYDAANYRPKNMMLQIIDRCR